MGQKFIMVDTLVDTDNQTPGGSGSNSADKETPTLVNFSSLKLPEFMFSNPALWLQVCESSFNTHHPKITRAETKYDYIIRALPSRVTEEISDVIIDKLGYTKLQEALVNRFTESAERRFERLLSGEELGDTKPSALLRKLRKLSAGENAVSDKFLKNLWMNRLP